MLRLETLMVRLKAHHNTTLCHTFSSFFIKVILFHSFSPLQHGPYAKEENKNLLSCLKCFIDLGFHCFERSEKMRASNVFN